MSLPTIVSHSKIPCAPESLGNNTMIPSANICGEGPSWSNSENELLWVDITGRTLSLWRTGSEEIDTWKFDNEVSAVIPRGRRGHLLTFESGFMAFDCHRSVPLNLERLGRGFPGLIPNDAKCDRRGRLWIGAYEKSQRPVGALFRVDADFSLHRMDEGFVMPNGLGWSPDDETMYFTDSRIGQIFAFDFDSAAGTVSNRRIFAEVSPDIGVPDGLTVDCEGFVWSAHWDGARITRYDPDGAVDRVVPLPCPRVTSCTFGGENFGSLFVTSATYDLSAEELTKYPYAGAVFVMDVGISGLPETPFAG